MNHCLSLLRTYAVLNKRYGNSLNFLTSTQLGPYDYFPDPIPDAFVRLKVEGLRWERLYLLYLFVEDTDFTGVARTVFNLIQYAEEDIDSWTTNTGREMPKVLLLCGSTYLQKMIIRKLRQAVYKVDSDLLTIYTATLSDLEQEAPWCNLLTTDTSLSLHDIR